VDQLADGNEFHPGNQVADPLFLGMKLLGHVGVYFTNGRP